jgi:O-antigen/teichoic acid export membrane protein
MFAIANMSTPAASILSGLITLRVLTPTETGALNSASLAPVYLSFIHLGILNAPSRDLPLALGAGRAQEAGLILRTSATTALLAGCVGALITLVVAGAEFGRHGGTLLFSALLANAAMTFMSPMMLHNDTALRGHQRFKDLTLALSVTSAVTFLSIGLVFWLHATGAVLRLLVMAVATILIRLPMGMWRFDLRLDRAQLLKMSKSGMPLLLSATIASYLMATDRSLTTAFMTETDVGKIALAGVIANSLSVIPQSLSLILLPKMAHEYGRTKSASGLRRYVTTSLVLNIATMVPCSIALYLAIGPLVDRFFPKYHDGITAARIACLTSLLAVYIGVGSVIGVLNKMTPYLVVGAFSILSIWVLGYIAVAMGFGINGIAMARLAGTVGLSLFTIIYSYRLCRPGKA